MKHAHRTPLAFALGLLALSTAAQDRFGDIKPRAPAAAPAPTTAPATAPAATIPPAAVARAREGGAEAQDFGIAPPTQLRTSDQLHAPTPTSIPGGRVVRTRELAQWMQRGGAARPLLLHALAGPVHLPHAMTAVPAAQGGSFDDDIQRQFGAFLTQATGGDRARLIVTYCQGVKCWGSYNAALRAIRLGYTNVHWYRGGVEAWQQAGLPLREASQASKP